MKPTKLILIIPFFLIFNACQNGRINNQNHVVDTIIYDVRVIDVETGLINKNQIIAVKDKKVFSVDTIQNRHLYTANQVVKGNDKFVMPSLIDLHVHINNENSLPMFLRFGVGLVFNLSGSHKELEIRDKVNTGEMLGPRLLTVGPTIDGIKKTNPLFIPIDSEYANDVVTWIKKRGYDGVKVYQQLDQSTLESIVHAATQNNLFVIGHVSRTAGIHGTLNSGLKHIAHGEELSFESFDEVKNEYNKSSIDSIVENLTKFEANFIANLNYVESISDQVLNLKAYLSTPEMNMVPADMFQSWNETQGWFSNRKDPVVFNQQIENMSAFVASLVKSAHDSGRTILLGTDSGFGGAIPGYSAHLELQSLVKTGLSPLEAIKAGTLNAGEYLFDNQLIPEPRGKITAGYAADFVFLHQNPLDNIKNTLKISGLFHAGKWYSKSDLFSIEQALKHKHKTNSPKAKLFEQFFLDGDIVAATNLVEEHTKNMPYEPLITSSSCIFLGYRYYYNNQKKLAGEFYQLCNKMLPNEPRILFYLAKINESEGKHEISKQYSAEAKKLDPWYK